MAVHQTTKSVMVGRAAVGGGSPVSVQSMLSLPSGDIEGNVRQAKRLEETGCEILRVAVPDMGAVRLVDAIKSEISIPLVADIHYDHRLALECVAAGIDKIRINPGNIGSDGRVKQVADACRQKGIPIRIGVNGGSLEKEILAKHGAPTAQALVESALYHCSLLERFDFTDIVISLKSSDVATMVQAYRLMAKQSSYPLHLGVTEAGTERLGVLRSAAGIGSLLLDGIGDTIRVSLTADPEKEVLWGIDLLKALSVRKEGIRIVSCPTCGRTKVDLISLAQQVEERLGGMKQNLRVAVMGCAVNGPGEAREADIGVACGDGCGLLFEKGEIIRKVPENEIVDALVAEVEKRGSGR